MEREIRISDILVKNCRLLLQSKLEEGKVDKSHGSYHAQKVLKNGLNALKQSSLNISSDNQQNILLACLLHDADDKKYFPAHKDYQNARQILMSQQISPLRIQNIISMISKVSYSKNGDQINPDNEQWFYYPRYADRIEAIGVVNLVRCYEFAQYVNNPMSTVNTAKPKTIKQIWEVCKNRDKQYIERGGTSQSIIDHIFDKLLHMSLPSAIINPFFHQKFEKSKRQLEDFILRHSINSYTEAEKEILQISAKQTQ